MEHITEAAFSGSVLEAEKPVVVDFWATWCGPCQMMAPVLEELAAERTDIKVCKVNVDEEMDLAMKYKVVSIPTILLFKNGEVEAKAVGFMSKESLVSALGI